ncbi:uncharacterized protein LOC128753979 [Synchiropus splendidus]|uniref:uncharacterized protein LOC128753979 n=1 Tax=Synchiropus splendidus TaxID=270530 RepID=UPI00237D6D7E|nr:uncharacterized protein LOC128753979 [Synchiropus splendidus]XP_053712225.1 uncharacterized protein LOC128753979 [Synchiropus splendidus]
MACSSDEINKTDESEDEIPQLIPIIEPAPMLPAVEDKKREETIMCPIENHNQFDQETCVGKLDSNTVKRNAETQQECQELELEIHHEMHSEDQDPSREVEKVATGPPLKKKRRLGMCSVIKREQTHSLQNIEMVPECDLKADQSSDLEATGSKIDPQASEGEPLERVETGGVDDVPGGTALVSYVNKSCEDHIKDMSCPVETNPGASVELMEEVTEQSLGNGCSTASYNKPSDVAEEKMDDSEAVYVELRLDTVEHTSRMPVDGAHTGPNILKPSDAENTVDEPGSGLAMNTDHLVKETNDQFGPEADHYVSDSQLNEAWVEEALPCDESPSAYIEDATELVCGLIQELSYLNLTVMSAHRELENLRRGGSRASRKPK